MYVLCNDTLLPRSEVSIDLEDRGYQFGDGVYEVIRYYHGRLFEMQAHLQRLVRSAREIQLALPVRPESLHQHLLRLLEKGESGDGIVYVQVTRGIAPRNHQFPEHAQPLLIAYATPKERPLEAMEKGIHAVTTEDVRWLRVDIKTINLLGNVLAKQKAAEAGAQEAVQIRDSIVTEGSSFNLFAIRGRDCYTHPANNLILKGITREVVLQHLDSINLRLRERPISEKELFDMDEVFLTSTTQEICPVVQIDGHVVGSGNPGPYTRKLQEAFNALIDTL